MGLRQIAKKIIQAGMDTGLGQAAINAGSDMLADQSVSEILYCYHLISNVFKPLLRSGHKAHHLFCSEVCAHLSTYKPGEFFRVSFPQHQFIQQSTLLTHFLLIPANLNL